MKVRGIKSGTIYPLPNDVVTQVLIKEGILELVIDELPKKKTPDVMWSVNTGDGDNHDVRINALCCNCRATLPIFSHPELVKFYCRCGVTDVPPEIIKHFNEMRNAV